MISLHFPNKNIRFPKASHFQRGSSLVFSSGNHFREVSNLPCWKFPDFCPTLLIDRIDSRYDPTRSDMFFANDQHVIDSFYQHFIDNFRSHQSKSHGFFGSSLHIPVFPSTSFHVFMVTYTMPNFFRINGWFVYGLSPGCSTFPEPGSGSQKIL